MEDIHDFDDTVVAVVADSTSAQQAASDLEAAGYEVEVLKGEQGKEHIDPAGETSPVATVKRLLNVFGDQYRVIERLNAALDEGDSVISVDAKPDEATRAVEIIQEHGGEFIWKLGSWTYSQVAD